MRTRLSLALVLAISLCVSGCIDVEAMVTVNKDGSGLVEETTLLSPQLSAMLSMASAQATQPAEAGRGSAPTLSVTPGVLMSRDAAEAKARQMGPGVTVRSLEDLKSPDGRQGQKVVFAFTNIGQVSYDTGDMKSASPAATSGGSISFALSSGTLTVRIKKSGAASNSAPGAAAGASPAATPAIPPDQMIAMMKPMLAGMRVAFRVKASSGIASTDATYVNGDTVTILDVQVDKLFDNPAVMAKLQTMSDSSSLSAAETADMLKGIPGVQADTKDTIVIKLK